MNVLRIAAGFSAQRDHFMVRKVQNRLPQRSPRNWHGMTMGIWFRLLRENRFAISPTRLPMAMTISMATCFNSVMRLVSESIYAKRANAIALRHPPLFILGHWRTGTTYLHELLIRDDRFSYPTTYDCMAPHHFLLTAGFFSRWFNWLLPSSRPMDNMSVGFLRPQEDEFALVNLGVGSAYLEWAFPNRPHDYDKYITLAEISDLARAQWQCQLKWFLQRLTLKDQRRLVLKSPAHTARIPTLLQLFPDASFIHIVRNPLEVIPSTVRMWQRMADSMALQVPKDRPLEDQILDNFERMYGDFNRHRSLISDSNYHEVRYEDLVTEPLSQLEAIYRQLDLGDFHQARESVSEYLAATKSYQTSEYSIANALEKKIIQRCGCYMRAHDYST
jgi:omega-hydroxy-beta-dihydromenaquinone-9 sulfotransferase